MDDEKWMNFNLIIKADVKMFIQFVIPCFYISAYDKQY